MTHWLDHSVVLAADVRVDDAGSLGPALRRRHDALAGLGTHHALVYESTAEPGRALVMIAIHAKGPLLDLIRSRALFEWFDAMGVGDIPAVFAGHLVDRMDLADDIADDGADDMAADSRPPAPEVMVSIVTPTDDPSALRAHLHDAVDAMRAAGVRTVSIFGAFDDPGEVMMLLQIDAEDHARSWLSRSDLAAEWIGQTPLSVYPPAFVGRLRGTARLDGP